MAGIGDRIVIYICSLAFATSMMIVPQTIIATLVTLSIMCFCVYMDDRFMLSVLYVLYILVGIKYPAFIAFYPVILYEILNNIWSMLSINEGIACDSSENKDGHQYHKNYSQLSTVKWIVICVELLFMITGILENCKNLDGVQNLTLFGIICMCIGFNIYYHKYISLKRKYIKTRDDSAELNLTLKNRNRYLIEKQDNEIHIATLKERNRIAREIHDNVGHMLSRSILQTGALLAVNKNEELTPFIESLKDTLNTAMTNIRTSVHDLYDESIDLEMAVKDILKEMEQYKIDFDYDVASEWPRSIKYCIITIIKEAISNILKHSNADKIHIIIREHPAFFQLLIHDNGTMIKEKVGLSENEDGIGLNNMRSRIEGLNGSFSISTDNGFRIFICIPKSNLAD